MVDRVEQDLGLKPERLIGDAAYGTDAGVDGERQGYRTTCLGLGEAREQSQQVQPIRFYLGPESRLLPLSRWPVIFQTI